MTLLEATDSHIEKFGKEPNIIGMFWNDIDYLIAKIEDSIKQNIVYDEFELLSDSQKKSFIDNKLFF